MLISRRSLIAGALAAPFLARPQAVLAAFRPSEFGAAMDGAADDAPALGRLVAAAAKVGRRAEIPAGNYVIGSNGFSASGLGMVEIACEDGVRFVNAGRLFDDASGGQAKRVPWSIGFDGCDEVRWSGGRIVTTGGRLRGRGVGVFTLENHGERRPVLNVERCGVFSAERLTLEGDPGPALNMEAQPWAAAIDAPQRLRLILGNAFFRARDCRSVRLADCALAPNACAREQWTMVDCGRVEIRGLTSRSTESNFASLAKIIRCGEVDVSEIDVEDPGSGSLVDVIADRFRYHAVRIDYPNGKLLDVSREWGDLNAPIGEGVIANCRTNGWGVVSVRGRSDERQVAGAPIGSIRIVDTEFSLAGDRSGDKRPPAAFRLGGVDALTVENCRFTNVAFDGAPSVRPSRLALTGCRFEWTSAATTPSRAIRTGVPTVYDGVSFAGVGEGRGQNLFFTTMKDTPGRHAFTRCAFRDLVLRTRGDVAFEDCTFENVERRPI